MAARFAWLLIGLTVAPGASAQTCLDFTCPDALAGPADACSDDGRRMLRRLSDSAPTPAPEQSHVENAGDITSGFSNETCCQKYRWEVQCSKHCAHATFKDGTDNEMYEDQETAMEACITYGDDCWGIYDFGCANYADSGDEEASGKVFLCKKEKVEEDGLKDSDDLHTSCVLRKVSYDFVASTVSAALGLELAPSAVALLVLLQMFVQGGA
jgi:hypothetical protein